MPTKADIGILGGFYLKDAAGLFVRIAEVISITPPNETLDNHDATNMDSPRAGNTIYREFIYGIADAGETSLEMNFLPGSASEDAIIEAKNSRQPRGAKIVFPNGATWTFDTLFTSYEPAMPGDDKMTATVSFKLTGLMQRGKFSITGTPPVGRIAQAFTFAPTVFGGLDPITFARSGTALPAGLTMNPATGAITGTPSAIAVTSGIIITATDANGNTAAITISITVTA